MKVNKILIPNKPHLDPIAAIYLLWKYGEDKFEGIREAKINYWEHSHDPKPEEIQNFEKDGVLTIDIGGGLFDHHNRKDADGETSTSLVAAYLGIKDNPELSALLSYVREDDLEGLHNRFGDLAYLLKVMHKQGMPSNEVITYALNLIDLLQKGQYEWHYEVKKEFEEKCKVYKIKRYKRKLKIGIIESDNIQAANYGLTVNNFSVIIQKRSSGHVMILTNKNHKIDLREAIAAIRKRELELMGYDKPIDTEKLKFEGKNSMLPNWFYHRSLNSFLNGSDALSKAEATKVSFKEIIKFVIYSLTTDKSELCDCDNGGEKCPYKNYGFSKCLEKKTDSEYKYKIDTDTKSLIIPLDNSNFQNLPENFIGENGKKFIKKDEFHITVIGYAKGNLLKSQIRNNNIEKFLNKTVNELNWSNFSLLPEKYLIKQDKEIKIKANNNEGSLIINGNVNIDAEIRKIHKEAIVQTMKIPALEIFYQRAKEAGIDLGQTPPAHVTLYTDEENKMGIGVNSEEEFNKMNPEIVNI